MRESCSLIKCLHPFQLAAHFYLTVISMHDLTFLLFFYLSVQQSKLKLILITAGSENKENISFVNTKHKNT